MPANIPLTFMVGAYNEERRLPTVLAHAVRWADEVIVVDKSSTDQTAAVARAFHPKVRVLTVPFSPQGQDEVREWAQQAAHDWIFFGTCSEIPTRRLVEEVQKLLLHAGDRLELVMVPRRMYSLGIHDPNSPWSVSYYPFLVHRCRALFTNVIHEHFKARNPANVGILPYAEDCCVHHLTHSTARRFVEAHATYAQVEAAVERDPQRAMVDWLKAIHEKAPSILRTGSDWPGVFSAWCLYNLMNVLFTWEKARGVDVEDYYQSLSKGLLRREWGVFPDSEPASSHATTGLPPASGCPLPDELKLQAGLRRTVFLAYAVANTVYHLQHPLAIPGSLHRWAAFQKIRLSRWIKG